MVFVAMGMTYAKKLLLVEPPSCILDPYLRRDYLKNQPAEICDVGDNSSKHHENADINQ